MLYIMNNSDIFSEEDESRYKNSCDLDLMKKIVVGPVEPVKILDKSYLARVDTGAKKCSISKSIIEEMDLLVIEKVEVRNTHGTTVRDVIKLDVELAGKSMKVKFNVSNRRRMQYPILIGRNLLKKGFLVDCSNESRDN
ncbi:MAG: hypothetical protein ACI83O_000793 [Patescibacteria group bacterium]|jgi:hypothetical protein